MSKAVRTNASISIAVPIPQKHFRWKSSWNEGFPFFLLFVLSDILNKERIDSVTELPLFKAVSHYISIVEVN